MKYGALMIFLLGTFSLLAQPKHPVVEVKGGKSFYVHQVEAGNSLWGIHMLYNVGVEEIVLANPGVENGIKNGQKIYIPIPVKKSDVELEIPVVQKVQPPSDSLVFRKHTVQLKETRYGIAKKYGVSMEELTGANPGIESGIKVGQVLKIPENGTVAEPQVFEQPEIKPVPKISFTDTVVQHTVLPQETMYSISKRFMVSVEDIQALNSLRNTRIRPGDVLQIPVRKEKIQKVAIREVKPVPVKKIDSTLLFKRKNEYAVAVLLPFLLDKEEGYSEALSNLAAEFYMGAKLAIDSLESAGFVAKIYFFDSKNHADSIDHLLNKEEFQSIDMIIGPLFPDKMGQVAAWCKEHEVRMVCPVAANAEILKENPFIYSAIPSDISLMEGAASYLLKRTSTDQIVIIKPVSAKDLVLYERFRAAFMSLPCAGARPKLIETTIADFRTYIKKTGTTTFVVPITDEVNAKKVIAALTSSTNNANNAITLFGTKEWMFFNASDGAFLNRFNFHFSSPNDFNYYHDPVKDLTRLYRQEYNADISKMAVQGYDVLFFFCAKFLMQQNPSHGIMSNFKMMQKGSGNGYENNNCFILKQEDYELVKLAETNE